MAGATRRRRKGNNSTASAADRKDDEHFPSFSETSKAANTRKRKTKQKSEGKSNKNWQDNSWTIFCIILGVGAVLTGIIVVLYRSASLDDETLQNDKMDQFLTWFLKSGGYIAPNVKLASFHKYGYGLLAMNPLSEDAAVSLEDDSRKVGIKEGDDLLVIPRKIQFNANTVLEQLRAYQTDLAHRIVQTAEKYCPANNGSPLEVQDIILALALMVECSLGQDSEYFEYICILPTHVPPRLDSFSNSELLWLEDPMMERLAFESKKQMYQVWNGGLSSSVTEWANAKSSSNNHNKQTKVDETCLSFGSFHRFLAIVSSHAMILDGTKFIAPMADMINHAPRLIREKTSQEHLDATFSEFHIRNAKDGSIAVKADRSVEQGQQILEEYGKLDNSLYLMAHGFVMEDNPYHCVMLTGDILPRVTDTELQHILDNLGIPTDLLMDGICVGRDGSIQGDYDGLVSSYLAVAHLEVNPALRKECLHAGELSSQVKETCTNFANAGIITHHMIQESARKAQASAQTTLEYDLSLLEQYLQNGKFSSALHDGTDPTRVALALRFRIADKQILQNVASDYSKTAL